MAARKSKSAQISNLQEFLVHELQDLYSAENQIVQSLPDLIDNATDAHLKQALKNHLEETKKHVVRLEKIFKIIDEKGNGKKCIGIEGILKEGEEILSEDIKGSVKDAAIIAAAQKVEHYEIGCYGTACAHAKELDLNEIADLLKETLDEEVTADKTLSKIALGSMFSGGVNTHAIGQGERKRS